MEDALDILFYQAEEAANDLAFAGRNARARDLRTAIDGAREVAAEQMRLHASDIETKAGKLGCPGNLQLAAYIAWMEDRIAALEARAQAEGGEGVR